MVGDALRSYLSRGHSLFQDRDLWIHPAHQIRFWSMLILRRSQSPTIDTNMICIHITRQWNWQHIYYLSDLLFMVLLIQDWNILLCNVKHNDKHITTWTWIKSTNSSYSRPSPCTLWIVFDGWYESVFNNYRVLAILPSVACCLL